MILSSFLTFILLLLMVAFSSLFSGLETGLTSIDPSRLRILVQQGSRRAKLVKRFIDRKEDTIGIILVGNNLMLVGCSALSTSLAIHTWGKEKGVLITSIAMTLILMIFGEILPKAIFLSNPEKNSLLMVDFLRFWEPLFKKPVQWSQKVNKGIIKYFNLEATNVKPLITKEEFASLLEGADAVLSISKDDAKMLDRIFKLDRRTLKTIMMPLSETIMVKVGTTVADVIEAMKRSGHSRLPVYEKTRDDPIGLIHYNDLLFVEDDRQPAENFIRKANFAPETRKIDRMLVNFQKGRFETALVVNEYGAAVGLVTVEDILEEIVGHIHDEFDPQKTPVVQLDKRKYQVLGETEVGELNERFKLKLPKGDYSTIAGLAYARLQKIPVEGESFDCGEGSFTITKMSNRRIMMLEMQVKRN